MKEYRKIPEKQSIMLVATAQYRNLSQVLPMYILRFHDNYYFFNLL